MLVAVDSNVLAYAEGVDDADRQSQAKAALREINAEIILPMQAIGELYNVLTRKARIDPDNARLRVAAWLDSYRAITATEAIFLIALEVAATHRMQFWDALILATAAENGCALLLSEDMQEGFVWRGITVANPFAKQPHSMLGRLLLK